MGRRGAGQQAGRDERVDQDLPISQQGLQGKRGLVPEANRLFPGDGAAGPARLHIANHQADHLAKRQIGISRAGKCAAQAAGHNQGFVLFLRVPGEFGQEAGFAVAGFPGNKTDASRPLQGILQPCFQLAKLRFAGDEQPVLNLGFRCVEKCRRTWRSGDPGRYLNKFSFCQAQKSVAFLRVNEEVFEEKFGDLIGRPPFILFDFANGDGGAAYLPGQIGLGQIEPPPPLPDPIPERAKIFFPLVRHLYPRCIAPGIGRRYPCRHRSCFNNSEIEHSNYKESNKMKKGYKILVAEANDCVVTYTAAEARAWLGDDSVIFVDIRDWPELERDGRIPGAVHASRGMLEFLVDPESPYYNPVFASGKRVLLYCASGGRSALAAQRLQEMGFDPVAHIGGGLKAWKEIGGDVAPI